MKGSQERIAGRLLDAEVHGRVMGRRVLTNDEMRDESVAVDRSLSEDELPPEWYNLHGERFERTGAYVANEYQQMLSRYSSEIAAAFQVVEAMRAKAGRNGCVFELDLDGDKNTWSAAFDMPHGYGAAEGMANPALAICLAAVSALDAETLSSQGAVESPSPLSSSHTPDGQ